MTEVADRLIQASTDALVDAHRRLAAGDAPALHEVVPRPAAFVRGVGGTLLPGPSLVAELQARARDDRSLGWDETAVPFFVKPLARPAAAMAALRRLVERLNGEPDAATVWAGVGSDAIYSLYLPGTIDLRRLLERTDEPAEILAVHDHCVAALLRYAAGADRSCQHAVAEDGCAPQEFDYAGRLARAVHQLTGRPEDDPVLVGRCDDLDKAVDRSHSALFYDPKPANFLVEATARTVGGHQTTKVDVDWMLQRGPLLHQGVVAVFSPPMTFRRGSVRTTLRYLVDRLVVAFGPWGADRTQAETLVFYHLTRNVAAKLRSSPSDAGELLPFLAALLDDRSTHPFDAVLGPGDLSRR